MPDRMLPGSGSFGQPYVFARGITKHTNLNNKALTYIMPATQADYDRIQAKIDEVGEDIAQLNRDMDKTRALLRSR